MLDRERDRGLCTAYSRLDERRQEHLWFTVISDLSYSEIAVALQMPVGSIGPTRALPGPAAPADGRAGRLT